MIIGNKKTLDGLQIAKTSKTTFSTIFNTITGGEATFCNGKPNGRYQSPNKNQYFFTCTNGQASPCQRCPGDLVFVEKCDQCLVHQPCKTIFYEYFRLFE